MLITSTKASRINIRKWHLSTNTLMEGNAEILLARSAAPDSISTRRSWSWDGKAMKQLSPGSS